MHINIQLSIVKANMLWQRFQRQHHYLLYAILLYPQVAFVNRTQPAFKTGIYTTHKRMRTTLKRKKVEHALSIPANHLQAQLL